MKKPKLTQQEYDELKEYTQEELNILFRRAIEDWAVKGFISSDERRHLLENIDIWLLELLEQ